MVGTPEAAEKALREAYENLLKAASQAPKEAVKHMVRAGTEEYHEQIILLRREITDLKQRVKTLEEQLSPSPI